jgi:hypothetical protein
MQALNIFRGMTMSTELIHTEWSGLSGPGGHLSGWPTGARNCLRSGFVWLPAALVAGLAAWMLSSGYASKPAAGEPASVAVAAAPARAIPSAEIHVSVVTTTPEEATIAVEAAPIDGLKITSQSWRRGGLGSNALVTFTLRNNNDYAVKDIAISCAFARRDGSHLTDRTRVIPDIVTKESRRTFPRMHVGFVNINAAKAKCALVAANHI